MKQPRKNFTFFWSGPFSQWAMYPIEIDGVRFNCNEQYMMVEKARLFKDEESLKLIMKALHPKQQKLLGKGVENFVQEVWDSARQNIVYEANYAKFTQHEALKQMLLDTGDTIIVEASPKDSIWGIGISEFHEDACDPDKWPGLNLLGKAIMEVRDDLSL